MGVQKPTIRIFDKTFTLQAVIDDYASLKAERNGKSVGEFLLTINYNLPNASFFQRGYFLLIGSDMRDFYVITEITDAIGTDGKGSQIRKITGYDARYIFKQRYIKQFNTPSYFTMTDYGETVMKSLVSAQCGDDCVTDTRVFDFLEIEDSAGYGDVYSLSEKNTNLLTVLEKIAVASYVNWYLEFDIDNKKLKLVCYPVTDKSNLVEFSTSRDSIKSGEFVDSSGSYANLIYVEGAGDLVYAGYSSATEPSGLDRFEYVDSATSLETEEEAENEATSVLAETAQTISVSGSGLAKSPYVYKTNYDVGDTVTVKFTGKESAVVLLSVTESWDTGSYEIDYEFGKIYKGLSQQLASVAQKNSVVSAVTAQQITTVDEKILQNVSDIATNATAITTKMTKITSTDNAIPRFNGTTGEVQNSGITIDDNNNITMKSVKTQKFSIKNGAGANIFASNAFGDVPIIGKVYAYEIGTSNYLFLNCYKNGYSGKVVYNVVSNSGLTVSATNIYGTVALTGYTTNANVRMFSVINAVV